jgi:NitT/TauT family transport system substrate-binding protein
MRVTLLASLVVVLFVAACSKPSSGKAPHMILGVSVLRISLPVFVAAQHGLFAKHGLEVELKPFETAQPLADDLAAGRLDAAGYVAFPILFGGAAPPRAKVLTAVVEDASHPITYLLTKKGSGLHGVAALKGRRIGTLPTIAYRRWLEAILKHDGVSLDDVTIMPMAPALEVSALEHGGIDALFTGDPMATAALASGVAEPMTDSPDVPRVLGDPFLFGTFAVGDAFLAAHPAEVKALREALDEAIGLIDADPAVGRAAMVPYVRETEKPFVEKYPVTRYLKSAAVRPADLDRALDLAGSKLRSDGVACP